MKRTRLRVGEVVRLDDQLWRVELVNPCRARIAPLDRRHVRYERRNGDPIEFEAAESRTLSICPDSEIERVDPATLENTMATARKTSKKPATEKKSRAPKRDELCTFAIRVPKALSAAIHKVAGPRNASKWAEAVLAAAAKGDLDGIKAAIGR